MLRGSCTLPYSASRFLRAVSLPRMHYPSSPPTTPQGQIQVFKMSSHFHSLHTQLSPCFPLLTNTATSMLPGETPPRCFQPALVGVRCAGQTQCLGVCVCVCVHIQSCLTLCDPIDCSPPGSSFHGILQARYCSGLPFPPPGDILRPVIEPMSPALAGRFLYH